MLLHALDFANVGLGKIRNDLDLVVVIIRRGQHNSGVIVVGLLVGTAKVLIDTILTNPDWTLTMLHCLDLR
jgi:hypothetical protein